jgi:hypothetical protein
MIQARPSTSVPITAAGFASGGVGTIGVSILAVDGTVIQPRSTAGISEVNALGVYTATLLVPAEPGAYLVVWDDGSDTASEELLVAAMPTVPVGQSTPADWTPTLTDVGQKLRARTVDGSGREQGTFGPTTRPTGDEVIDITVEEVGALAAYVGTDLPVALWPLAKSAALARIAARIELDYWPEQVRSDRSPYTELAGERDREESRLIGAVRATGAAEGGGRSLGTILTRPAVAVASEAATPLGILPWQTASAWPDDHWGLPGSVI